MRRSAIVATALMLSMSMTVAHAGGTDLPPNGYTLVKGNQVGDPCLAEFAADDDIYCGITSAGSENKMAYLLTWVGVPDAPTIGVKYRSLFATSNARVTIFLYHWKKRKFVQAVSGAVSSTEGQFSGSGISDAHRFHRNGKVKAKVTGRADAPGQFNAEQVLLTP